MTTRLHFAPADLAGVRFAATIGPLAEAWESIEVLRDRAVGAGWVPWRARVRGSRPGSAESGLLGGNVASAGCLADLVSVIGHHPSPRKAVAAFLAASAAQLAAEAEHAMRCAQIVGWPLTGFTGTQTDREQFLRALHSYARRLVGGQWASIEAFLMADLRSRTAPLASEGLGAVLRSLHPSVHWDDATATLLVEDGTYRDIKLAGRGLLVVPKFFTSRVKVHVPMASNASTILAYPAVQPGQDHLPWIEPAGDGLAGILGATRATMLKEISEGMTAQQDLAAATGTTGAAIGQHAAKLRAAGLIATVRRDGRAYHVLTAAGDAIVANTEARADGSPRRVESVVVAADHSARTARKLSARPARPFGSR